MAGKQKVVIITGASQGIGAALVPAYRKLGYARWPASGGCARARAHRRRLHRLSVLVRRTSDGWLLDHYQVSRLD